MFLSKPGEKRRKRLKEELIVRKERDDEGSDDDSVEESAEGSEADDDNGQLSEQESHERQASQIGEDSEDGPSSDVEEDEEEDEEDDDEDEGDDDTNADLEIASDVTSEAGEDDIDMDKLRQYQLERLRYYYAIATFSTDEAAAHVMAECQGTEFERTANVLDLSYVPAEMEFANDEIKLVDRHQLRYSGNH
jgi:hypothetical protein